MIHRHRSVPVRATRSRATRSRASRVLACLAFAAAPSATPALETIAFGPADGSRVEKAFELSTALELASASLVVDGEYEEVDVRIDAESTARLVVAETYGGTAAGRPLRLDRSFEAVGGSASADSRTEILGGGAVEVERASPLEGRSVRFEREPGDADFTARFTDTTEPPSEADRALLDGLDADLDLLDWLPSGDLAVGDGWEVETEALVRALRPGGDLALAPTDPDRAERLEAFGAGGGLVDLLGTPSGTIQGRLAELTGPAGARTARLEYTIDVRFLRELDGDAWPAFTDPRPPGEDEVAVEVERTRLDGLVDRGTATLVWDLEARRFAGFELDLVVDLAAEQDLVLRLGRSELAVGMELSWTLTQRLEATAR